MFLFAVMVLHGGPGGASQEVYRQYFDPKAYRVIQIDQRGCGRSTPHAELQENNTQVASLEITIIDKIGSFQCSMCYSITSVVVVLLLAMWCSEHS